MGKKVTPASVKGWQCRTHVRKLIEAFCEDCHLPVCIECIVTNRHKGHEILGLEEAAVKSKAVFGSLIDTKVKESASQVKEEMLDLKQVEELISTQKDSYTSQIKSVFLKIKKLLTTLETKILQQVETQYQEAIVSCKQVAATLDTMAQHLDTMR
jgi:flagellar capping protein FliD